MNIIRQGSTKATDIRKRLGHPVVDGDGHFLETNAVLLDYVKQVAGAELAEGFANRKDPLGRIGMKQIFWGQPSGPHTLDRATAMMPRLFAERLSDAGIDFGVVYSTAILGLMHEPIAEYRQAGHRALNTMLADMFRGTEDRLAPSAGIPMFSPEEAIQELEFAVGDLGFRAATFGTEVRVTPSFVPDSDPELGRSVKQITPVALDALHDYDPVWRKCIELKIAVASHTSSRGNLGRRSSPSNYIFNHLGDFAAGGNYFCRNLFLGGVTRRFPELNFSFLEGGASWASQLYNDLVEHWEKRNVDAMKANLDPALLDIDLMGELAEQFGNGILTPEHARDHRSNSRMGGFVDDIEIDEFAAAKITCKADIATLYADPFYFGCEADDRLNAVAFNPELHHGGIKLKAMFGSDIGHWDVIDMLDCLPEAHEAVEDGLMSDKDFQDFVFTNPVSFFTKQNPDFFKGTTIEDAVSQMNEDN